MPRLYSFLLANFLLLLLSGPRAFAHDPIFGIGPHVLFKGGLETSLHLDQASAGASKDSEVVLEIAYGITGDWSAGIELPYVFRDESTASSNGTSDIELFTKYRFWREDSLGVQESAAISLLVNVDNADEKVDPPLGNGAVDSVIGITYGYESLKWYRWVSLRKLNPGRNSAGFELGDKYLLDFAGGWRPKPPVYRDPDTVWLLELNAEFADRASLNGNDIADSGGTEWFLSPGIFWTSRNFAVKAGLQLPLTSDLNGSQEDSDYRFSSTFEWHL